MTGAIKNQTEGSIHSSVAAMNLLFFFVNILHQANIEQLYIGLTQVHCLCVYNG